MVYSTKLQWTIHWHWIENFFCVCSIRGNNLKINAGQVFQVKLFIQTVRRSFSLSILEKVKLWQDDNLFVTLTNLNWLGQNPMPFWHFFKKICAWEKSTWCWHVTCGLRLLLVLTLAMKSFFQVNRSTPVLPPLQNPTLYNFNLMWNG